MAVRAKPVSSLVPSVSSPLNLALTLAIIRLISSRLMLGLAVSCVVAVRAVCETWISSSAPFAARRTIGSLSPNAFLRTGTALIAAGPILPRAIAARWRTYAFLSDNVSTRAGTPCTAAAGPILPNASAPFRRTCASLLSKLLIKNSIPSADMAAVRAVTRVSFWIASADFADRAAPTFNCSSRPSSTLSTETPPVTITGKSDTAALISLTNASPEEGKDSFFLSEPAAYNSFICADALKNCFAVFNTVVNVANG